MKDLKDSNFWFKYKIGHTDSLYDYFKELDIRLKSGGLCFGLEFVGKTYYSHLYRMEDSGKIVTIGCGNGPDLGKVVYETIRGLKR